MRYTAVLLFLLSIHSAMAYEQAFPPTAPGVAELKTLPAGTLLKSSAPGNYFDQSGHLFRPLFSYISANDIKMTIPVEAAIDAAAMYFWVGPAEVAKARAAGGEVEVVHLPERPVAAYGAKGAYTQENFEKTRASLLAWLATRTDVEPAGPAYAVYWNGPFTLWFNKRYEVLVPVRPKS